MVGRCDRTAQQNCACQHLKQSKAHRAKNKQKELLRKGHVQPHTRLPDRRLSVSRTHLGERGRVRVQQCGLLLGLRLGGCQVEGAEAATWAAWRCAE